MSDYRNDILDDEVRIIGKSSMNVSPASLSSSCKSGRKWALPLICIVSILFMVGILIIFWPRPAEPLEGIFERQSAHETPPSAPPAKSPPALLGKCPDTEASIVERIDTVINDIPLSLFIPHNLRPELIIGAPNPRDTSILLAAQAADIRADNLKILGSFVYKGEVVARGTSKKGFCAIIDGNITVGVAEDTPLFERSTRGENYFFRQFPLVDNGTLVENEQKNKSIRKALCDRAGQIFIAATETDESFHDFSQALVDLGCTNAIYLVGSRSAYGWAITPDSIRTSFGKDVHKYRNENYIIWRRISRE